MKPGSAGPGVPGIHPIIYDDEGVEITEPGIAGNICTNGNRDSCEPSELNQPMSSINKGISFGCRFHIKLIFAIVF